jgi:hypothetical protein
LQPDPRLLGPKFQPHSTFIDLVATPSPRALGLAATTNPTVIIIIIIIIIIRALGLTITPNPRVLGPS